MIIIYKLVGFNDKRNKMKSFPHFLNFLKFSLENVPFPLEAVEDAERSCRKHLRCRLHDLALSHRRPLCSLVS